VRREQGRGFRRFRLLYRAGRLLVVAAIAVAAAPVTIVAGIAALTASQAGWPPRRLYATALWALPITAVWLIAIAAGMGGLPADMTVAGQRPWQRTAAAPYRAWVTMWHLAGQGRLATAAITIAPVAVPAGLAVGGLVWAWRLFVMDTGAGGRTPAAPVAFDLRQWRRQVRTARARIAAPGAVPLLAANGDVVAGATIRTVRHPARPVAAIPYPRMRSHQVIIGSTGTGKTTLLLRLWAGFMAEGMRRRTHPLLVVIDCKGGASSRKVADRVRRVMRDAGARSTAIWPDEASLSLWDLPPRQLITTLLDLIEHGSGGAAYYRDVLEAIVALAVDAPCGPPADSADFLARLDPDWLARAYTGVAEAQSTLRSAKNGLVNDAALRFRTLWRRLGPGFDGPGQIADADAWYCVVEGTAETAVAEAQARALVDLLAHYVTASPGREVLLAVDEFSAVSRRLPIWQLYERARSLGLAVQVTSQSWEGLAADDDERYRIATTAEGGIWLLRTPRPEPVAELAGTRRLLDTARSLIGAPRWDQTGSSRVRLAPVLDPDLVRQLDIGQAAYLYRGGVTFVQVKRLVAKQAALDAGERPPEVPRPRDEAIAPGATPPDAGSLLDEAFPPRSPLRPGRDSTPRPGRPVLDQSSRSGVARGHPPAARRERTRATSASLGFWSVTAVIACRIAPADSGSVSDSSSPAMAATSSLVSWLPSSAKRGM
jgi:Type IV secretion-system coupling protein DNA-binding domain